MSKLINFPTATKEEMMAINEVVFANVITDGNLSLFCDVRTGVESGDRLAWVNPLSMVGKPSRGCEPEDDTPSAVLVEKKWDLKSYDFRIAQCYTDLEQILYRLGLKEAAERGDLSGTDYAAFMDTLVTNAMDSMYKRFVWFGDTEAANVADGGKILNGVDVDFYTVVDGIFKQIDTMIAAGDEGVVVTAIGANAKATYALQMSEVWDPIAILTSVILDADVAIEAEEDQELLVSRFFMNKLKAKMLSLPQYTESQFTKNEQGMMTVTFLGYTVVEMKEWDHQIKNYIQDGTKYYKPFRALFTTKSNLKVGVPSTETFYQLLSWYEKKDRKYYTDAADKIDVIVMRGELVSIAH